MSRHPFPHRQVRRAGPAAVVALALVVMASLLAGCSSDDEGGDEDAAATTEAEATSSTVAGDGTLTILVSNDDGVGAPGIDVLVEALRALPDTEVIVAAPAQNQSGSASKTTPGGAQPSAATTASGFEATAVAGFPADSVNWALEGGIDVEPELVVSGINSGQNLGQLVELSGTVGAARAGAAQGVPALAVSAGLADAPSYEVAAELVVEWVEEHRAELLAGTMTTDTIENLNVPTCTAGEVRGVLEVRVDMTSEVRLDPVDCSVEAPGEPTTDLAAFSAGYAPLSVLPATPAGPPAN